MSPTMDSETEAKRRSTVLWVVGLATLGLIFDGYDLVVYGTVVSTFLRNPNEIGPVTPQAAGALGSYALIGVLVGALLAGTVGDILGRRKVMLTAYAWFAVGMGATAMTHTSEMFGLLRFITGLGVGALVATTGALVNEYAPPGKKNLINAITYSGVPIGSLMAALLAIILLDLIGWRGMFWIGALPLVTLLPLAIFKMPESVAWLASRGRLDEARAISARTGIALPEEMPSVPGAASAGVPAKPAAGGRAGFAGLFGPGYLFPTLVLGLMSATGLVLVYSLNTWLPELMLRAGFNAKGSLSFLLVLNGGAILGALAGSRIADRLGPKPVVAGAFLIGAVGDRRAHPQRPARHPAGHRRDRRARHQRHPDADLRLCGQLLPDQRARRRGGLVRGLRPLGRRRGTAARRLPGRRGSRPRLDLLRPGWAGAAGSGPDVVGAGRPPPRELRSTLIEPTRRRRRPVRRARPNGVTPGGCQMYERILLAIDMTPTEENRSALTRTEQIGRLTGATVYLLHVARAHIVPGDIIGGSGLGVLSAEDDVEAVDRQAVQQLVDSLAAAGVEAHGEIVSATEHDIADVILQRAKELDVDLVVLGHQHHRGVGNLFQSSVAERVIRRHPPYSILLARPPATSGNRVVEHRARSS